MNRAKAYRMLEKTTRGGESAAPRKGMADQARGLAKAWDGQDKKHVSWLVRTSHEKETMFASRLIGRPKKKFAGSWILSGRRPFFLSSTGVAIRRRADGELEVQRLRQRQSRQSGFQLAEEDAGIQQNFPALLFCVAEAAGQIECAQCFVARGDARGCFVLCWRNASQD